MNPSSDAWGLTGAELAASDIRFAVGDVFFTRSQTWLGKAIRWATTGYREEPSETNHVGMVVGAGVGGDALIVEALHRVRFGTFADLYGKETETQIQVWRDGLTPSQAETAAYYMNTRVGDKYNYARIGANLVDSLLAKLFKKKDAYVFRRFAFLAANVCSTLVAEAYQRAGASFGMDAARSTPDDELDWVKANWMPGRVA